MPPKAEAPEAPAETGSPKGPAKKGPASPKQLSAGTLLDLNELATFEFANEPGPGHYFGPESVGFGCLGKQRFAKCKSEPEISIPRTGWDKWKKIRISGAHEKTFMGNNSAGCVYNLPDPDKAPAPKIGTSLRPALERSLGVDPHGSPGPTINIRDTQSVIKVLTEREGQVKKGFGLAPRFGKAAGAGGVGPGEYGAGKESVNTQNGRSIGAGRAQWEKVLTPGAPDEGKACESKGPGPPLWRDIKKEGSRGMPIGKAKRFPRSYSESCSPGPVYRRDERDCARTKHYMSDTRNPAVTKFGKPPTKPRFRMMLALTCNNAGWGYF